jgi:hypothetical protein
MIEFLGRNIANDPKANAINKAPIHHSRISKRESTFSNGILYADQFEIFLAKNYFQKRIQIILECIWSTRYWEIISDPD